MKDLKNQIKQLKFRDQNQTTENLEGQNNEWFKIFNQLIYHFNAIKLTLRLWNEKWKMNLDLKYCLI